MTEKPPGDYSVDDTDSEESVSDQLLDEPQNVEFSHSDNPFPFNSSKHKADTSRVIAYLLIGILGLSFVIHYASVMIFSDPVRMESFKSAFNSWLPIISGLASAAVTYYFTRERDME